MKVQAELFRDDYALREKSSAKARYIRLEVRSGSEVLLVYPRGVARSEALSFLRSRQNWLRDKLAQMRERERCQPAAPVLRWDGSDEMPLRGTSVPVAVERALLRRLHVRVGDDRITLFCAAAELDNPRLLGQALKREMMRQARLDAQRLLDAEAVRLGVRYSALRINDPRTLWGSCNPGGTICLSWRLVMAPPPVFRYVAVHELCHLVHHNHSARYWRLVGRQMPEYETHKRWLRDEGAALHLHLQ